MESKGRARPFDALRIDCTNVESKHEWLAFDFALALKWNVFFNP